MSPVSRRKTGRSSLLVLLVVVAIVAGAVVVTVGPEASVAVPGLLAGAAVLTRPILGLIALTFPVPFEDALLVGGATTITKLMGAAVAGLWIGHKVLRGESWRDTLSSPLIVFGILFVAFAAASYIWAEYPAVVVSGIFRLVMLVALTVLVIDIVKTWSHVSWLIRALVAGGIVAGALVISQYFGLGVRRAGDQVAGGVNATALVLVTLLPFGFYLIRSGDGVVWRVTGVAYVATALVAVVLTFSRMGFLLVPFVLLVEGLQTFRKRRGRVSIAVLAAISAIIAIRFVPMDELRERVETIGPYIEATLSGRTPERPYLSGRGYHLYVAYRIFQDHPVLGVGYENYGRQFLRYQLRVSGSERFYNTPRNPHSSFAGVLSELGLVGLGIWLTILGAVLVALMDAWRKTRSDPSSREYLVIHALVVSFILLLAYGFYAEMQYEKIFWLVLGISVVARRLTNLEDHPFGGDTSDNPREMQSRSETRELTRRDCPLAGSRQSTLS